MPGRAKGEDKTKIGGVDLHDIASLHFLRLLASKEPYQNKAKHRRTGPQIECEDLTYPKKKVEMGIEAFYSLSATCISEALYNFQFRKRIP